MLMLLGLFFDTPLFNITLQVPWGLAAVVGTAFLIYVVKSIF